MQKALRSTVEQYSVIMDVEEEDEKIDYSSVGLYLSALQTVATVVTCACVAISSCWLLPDHTVSSVRTLALTSVTGLVLVRKPLRVGRVRGVATIFNALRPAVALYIAALVVEQLVHTCSAAGVPNLATPKTQTFDTTVDANLVNTDSSTLRRIGFHLITALMISAGFARARAPRSESDIPFALTTFAILALAIAPPPALQNNGPLCSNVEVLAAGERVLRALFFAMVYTVHVYSSAPQRNVSNELFICTARAGAAAAWILAASAWTLPLAPLQVAIVLFARLGESSADAMASEPLNGLPPGKLQQYESVPLHNFVEQDIDHQSLGGGTSDVESGDTTQMPLASLPQVHKIMSNRPAAPLAGSGGLNFNFGGAVGGAATPASSAAALNVAAIVARESRVAENG